MERFFKTLSLAPRSIRNKLTVAFIVMSVIPILACGYLISHYIIPTISTAWEVYLIILIVLTLMLLGFYLAKKIIYPIVEITAHAQLVAKGDALDKHLEIKQEDEIGELSGSLNQLSTRLKDNMSELHSYGEKIKQINMEINRKVFALSSLLQIGNLITTAADLDEVLQLIAEKLAQVEVNGAAFLMLLEEDSATLAMCAQVNIEDRERRQLKIRAGQGLLGKVVASAQPLVIDSQKPPKPIDKDLQQILSAKNLAVVPVTSSGKVIGILGTANDDEKFIFSDDEIELIGVFAKQVAVAIENDTLLRKTEELAVKDELTGLYNESYIRNRLDEEIKRAITYQRPCSFIIFEVDDFERYRAISGEIVAEKALKKIARTLTESTSNIDKVARFSEHQFAVVLPERNKKQSLGLAENITKEIERFSLSQTKTAGSGPLRLSGGITATPIDGTTSVELINKTLSYIEKAKGARSNKVVTS